jgi:hypothetical protein
MSADLLLLARHELKQALIAFSNAKKEAYHIKQVQERPSCPKEGCLHK